MNRKLPSFLFLILFIVVGCMSVLPKPQVVRADEPTPTPTVTWTLKPTATPSTAEPGPFFAVEKLGYNRGKVCLLSAYQQLSSVWKKIYHFKVEYWEIGADKPISTTSPYFWTIDDDPQKDIVHLGAQKCQQSVHIPTDGGVGLRMTVYDFDWKLQSTILVIPLQDAEGEVFPPAKGDGLPDGFRWDAAWLVTHPK